MSDPIWFAIVVSVFAGYLLVAFVNGGNIAELSGIPFRGGMMWNAIDKFLKEFVIKQTYCYTCGKRPCNPRYECPICHEWQCSKECLMKHVSDAEE